MRKMTAFILLALAIPAFGQLSSDSKQSIVQPWDNSYHRVISMFIDTLCGKYYMGLYIPIGVEHGRTSKKKAPGDYLMAPSLFSFDQPPVALDQTEIDYLAKSLSGILTEPYWSPDIINHIQKYRNVLKDSSRNEFYGRMVIDDKKFAIGGWFGKLTVAGVLDEYDNVSSFVNKAKTYFRLPDIDPGNVKIVHSKSGEEFFYSFLDRESKFWLRGYNIELVYSPDRSIRIKSNVIELLKYYEKDFVP